MKQIIPFVKDISLESKISEITSIALEHNLKMENSDSIVGVFTVSGKYKINEISINEEVFEKKINFDITLDDKYDASKVMIDVDDFYYEIINEEYLRVHIDVKVDNLIYFKEESTLPIEEKEPLLEEIRLKDDHETNDQREESEESTMDIKEENVLIEESRDDDNKIDVSQITNNITSNFLGTEEKYSTYKVHIIREEENIETIMEKYNVSKEELEKYNSLDNVILGTKIIVPIMDE